MDLAPHVLAIQADLAATAALAGEEAAEVGRRLAAALESSLQLRLLDVLTEASLALDPQLRSGHVEVRLAGRDPQLVLVEEQDDHGGGRFPADDTSARITLRLPEGLKTQVETAAGREGVSTNAWVVRSLAHRLRGFAQS